MSTAYYYFGASLPLLEFAVKPPFSVEDFQDDCVRLLGPRDLEDLRAAIGRGAGKVHNPFLRAWQKWEEGLRNEAVWLRSQRLGRDPLTAMRDGRPGDPGMSETLSRAAKASDPLEAEKMIDRLRWEKVDELSKGHFFDLEFILAFALKLKILQRYQVVESSRGEQLFAQVREDAAWRPVSGGREEQR